MYDNKVEVDYCIVGSGPAGAFLSYLLAQQGQRVLLLDKALDFNREFRGNGIYPDSVLLLKKYGVLEKISDEHISPIEKIQIFDDAHELLCLDFQDLFPDKPLPIELPQKILISTLVSMASQFNNFELKQGCDVFKLIEENGKITGLMAKENQQITLIKASMIIGADGRYSKIRDLANFSYQKYPMTRDVLWFQLPRPSAWPLSMRVAMQSGNQLTAISTCREQLRCGLSIPKNSFSLLKQGDISELRKIISPMLPIDKQIITEKLQKFDDFTLLDIFTTSVQKWSKPGLLLIGDAAHTLTPILGQGINMALQDSYYLAKAIEKSGNNNLAQFELQRKAEADFMLSCQLKQEKILLYESTVKLILRKMGYFVVNNSQIIKRRVFGKILHRLPEEHRVS